MKVTLTYHEAVQIIRNSDLFQSSDTYSDAEIIIEPKNESSNICVKDSDVWYHVPTDHSSPSCPIEIKGAIQVVYRNETTDSRAKCSDWTWNWFQEGHAYDIVKFRSI